MSMVVSKQVNLKFLIDEGLKDRLDLAFEDQGVSLTVGVTRLIRFFLDDAKAVRDYFRQAGAPIPAEDELKPDAIGTGDCR